MVHLHVKCQAAETTINQQGDFYIGVKNIFYIPARIVQLIDCCFCCLTLACERTFIHSNALKS